MSGRGRKEDYGEKEKAGSDTGATGREERGYNTICILCGVRKKGHET